MSLDYWLYLNDLPEAQLFEIARAAESAGFRGVALADHVAVPVRFDGGAHPSGRAPFDHRTAFPDPLITAAAILASTSKLLVMSYVYVLPMREPFSVAKQVATLAALSGGRFRFGVGAGWMLEEIALLGHPVADRGRRMDEMLEIIRAFWTRDEVEFHGEFFDFAPAGVAPRPPAPVPIWVGGKSRPALERAARQDGWLGMNYPLPEVHALLERLHATRRSRASSGPFEVFVIPSAPASIGLYRDLEARGVTSTMAFAFPAADPRFETLAAKRDALARFADAYLGG
jgi:probable F420-dependent oxidoreductase